MFLKGIQERYARRGILLVPAGLNELLRYVTYTGMASVARVQTDPPRSDEATKRDEEDFDRGLRG